MTRTIELKKPIPPFPLRTCTLPALFRETVALNAARAAMKTRGGAGGASISYEEFGRLVSRLGAGLIARGVAPGDRVGLLADNGPEWGFVYAAATSIGAAIVPLDTQLKGAEIRRFLVHSNAKVLFVSPRLLDEGIADAARSGLQLVIIGDESGVPGTLALNDLVAEGARAPGGGPEVFEERARGVKPDDVAAICYTSGTTGEPKGVVLSNRNLVSNVESCRRRIPFIETDTFLSLLPLHHTYSTTCNLLAPLSTGAAIFFGRSLKSRDIRDDIERQGVTVICGVPLLFEKMAKTIEKRVAERPAYERFLLRATAPAVAALGRATRRNTARALFRRRLAADGLASIRFCVSGAAALKDDVESSLSMIGIAVLQGYGMTEASPVISVNPLGRARRGSLGPPLPGVEVRIGEPDDGGAGEILVRGPNVMAGYLDNPRATAEVLRDGWLHTGDIGKLGRDGYLTFIGRMKSVIVTAGGKNVYADEIETALNGCWCILESIVLPAKDRKGNEQVAAIIVPDHEAISASREPAGNLTDEGVESLVTAEVRKICAELPEYKRIREVRIRNEELPKTSTRKVKRHLVTWPGK
ncbi:MAG: AMP-binding protein [Candidatus Krumholzibacteriaceae bacterium]